MNYENYDVVVPLEEAQSASSERTVFIQRVYMHLAGAILAFVALETLLVKTFSVEQVFGLFAGKGMFGLLALMALFMGAGYLAQAFARSRTSPGLQYLGLGLYVALEAVIIFPLICYANVVVDRQGGGASLIPTAGILTLCVFAGLTMSVFFTGKDYSFLAPVLSVATMISLGVIVCAILFGFSLGLLFSFLMVALMSGYILYDTSNVIHHYPTDMYVSAALALFADVATLFYYILRIMIEMNRSR